MCVCDRLWPCVLICRAFYVLCVGDGLECQMDFEVRVDVVLWAIVSDGLGGVELRKFLGQSLFG